MFTTAEIQAHVAYLRSTLIPDLRGSGMEATADDFETSAGMIDQLLDLREAR